MVRVLLEAADRHRFAPVIPARFYVSWNVSQGGVQRGTTDPDDAEGNTVQTRMSPGSPRKRKATEMQPGRHPARNGFHAGRRRKPTGALIIPGLYPFVSRGSGD